MSTQTDDRPIAPLATTLERFFATKTSADVDGTMSYFAPDLVTYTDVFADMSLRAQLIGRIETARYLGRVLADVPYGRSSSLRHVVGGAGGGGFEWTAGPDHGGLVGITALELDADGFITKVTSVYDSRQLSPARRAALAGASLAQ